MRIVVGVLAATALFGCKGSSRLDEMLEASTMSATQPPPSATPTAAAPTAPPAPSSPVEAGAAPPRPIPLPAFTVGSGEPAEVQMKAIAYMAWMAAPRADDAPADKTYADNLALQLRPIVSAMDRGTDEDKLRLSRVEVVASGRRIDLFMADGCDAQMPGHAVQRVAPTYMTLLSHGVLVVRCNDAHVQCLQSMRNAADILCTTAPRHR